MLHYQSCAYHRREESSITLQRKLSYIQSHLGIYPWWGSLVRHHHKADQKFPNLNSNIPSSTTQPQPPPPKMPVLGKRKAPARSETSPSEALSAEEIFRRHFEAQFAPIDEDPVAKRQAVAEGDEEADSSEDGVDSEEEGDDDEDEGEEDDEWGGLSDDEISDEEDEVAVEVIDYSTSQPKTEAMSKSDLKSFMVSPLLNPLICRHTNNQPSPPAHRPKYPNQNPPPKKQPPPNPSPKTPPPS